IERASGLRGAGCYIRFMTLTLKARVQGGRLVLDEPIDLPEGTEVELVPANEEDNLDDADRARLHESLLRSAKQFDAGKGVPSDEVLKRLGARDAPRRRRSSCGAAR